MWDLGAALTQFACYKFLKFQAICLNLSVLAFYMVNNTSPHKYCSFPLAGNKSQKWAIYIYSGKTRKPWATVVTIERDSCTSAQIRTTSLTWLQPGRRGKEKSKLCHPVLELQFLIACLQSLSKEHSNKNHLWDSCIYVNWPCHPGKDFLLGWNLLVKDLKGCKQAHFFHFSGITSVYITGGPGPVVLPAHSSEQKKHDAYRPVYNSNTENLYKITAVANHEIWVTDAGRAWGKTWYFQVN